MKRAAAILLFSFLLALAIGEFLVRSFAFRHWLGKVTGRGELQILVRQKGLYDRDVERLWKTELYLRDGNANEVGDSVAREEKKAALERLIRRARLEAAAAGEPTNQAELEHGLELIRWEFRDEKGVDSLGKSPWNAFVFREEWKNQLRARRWLEAKISDQLSPNESETRRNFDEHPARWQEPPRWRASHLFLAAPDGSPDELVEAKRTQIELLAKRLTNGDSFPALAAEFSEDEATKKLGGDLGYFAEERMLPEIITAVRLLQVGEISPPTQSRLGFHLLRLTESLPARALSYEEARPEIMLELENQQRTSAMAQLIAALP
jgi:parvulin-like peptidyl-prolyl isomerase